MKGGGKKYGREGRRSGERVHFTQVEERGVQARAVRI